MARLPGIRVLLSLAISLTFILKSHALTLPALSTVSNTAQGQNQNLSAVVERFCHDVKAPFYGAFDFSRCGPALRDLYNDPDYPNNRKVWRPSSHAPSYERIWGKRSRHCWVVIATYTDDPGYFTLADVEVGLRIGARNCAVDGKGGREYYSTFDKVTGHPLMDYRLGWRMEFFAPWPNAGGRAVGANETVDTF